PGLGSKKNFGPQEMCFFLTSTFIENFTGLIRTLSHQFTERCQIDATWFALLGGLGAATGMSNDVHVGDAFGWNAELLLEFLVGNPLEGYVGKLFKGRNIDFGIVNRDAHVQGVMVHARIAFLHAHVHAMRMARRIEPGPLIHADAINDECVVPVPMAYRIAIPAGRRAIFGVDALGKLSPVRPDLAPDSLVLIEHDHAVR